MGCPILLGYAEKAKEVFRGWSDLMDMEIYQPDMMVREAMRARSPSKELAARRAGLALRIIVTDMLKRALLHSEMSGDAAWLKEVPEDLEPVATAAVLQRIRDRAIAWNVEHSLQEGKDKTVGELDMVFTERVWQIVGIADSLLHDMTQESYTSAGMALAHTMAALKVETAEWFSLFEKLEEVE